eukprot:scaffold649712_cov37-Prasinocladus_malaysianus.AAC.1
MFGMILSASVAKSVGDSVLRVESVCHEQSTTRTLHFKEVLAAATGSREAAGRGQDTGHVLRVQPA